MEKKSCEKGGNNKIDSVDKLVNIFLYISALRRITYSFLLSSFSFLFFLYCYSRLSHFRAFALKAHTRTR